MSFEQEHWESFFIVYDFWTRKISPFVTIYSLQCSLFIRNIYERSNYYKTF